MRAFLVSGIVLTALALAGATRAAPPALYKGSAQPLLPTAAEVGYAQITSQSGASSRASATYETPSSTYLRSMKLAIRVFKSDAAAVSSFEGACAGCQLRRTPSGSWKYKIGLVLGADGKNAITFVARCRNLRVDTVTATASTNPNPHQIAGPSVRIADGIFRKAQRLGMSSCAGGGSAPPPPTGTYYWSETFAEQILVAKLKIPNCNVNPDNPNCRTQAPFPVVKAECRGLDEKRGTFTYSRFTCEIRAGYSGNIGGRIAVWPTGPTTFRWEIL